MMLPPQFPKTLAAVEAADKVSDKPQWRIADALLDEIPVSPSAGRGHSDGSGTKFVACVAELAERGYDYTPDALRAMRNTAAVPANGFREPLRASFTLHKVCANFHRPELLAELLSVLDGKRPKTVPSEVQADIRKKGRVTANHARLAIGQQTPNESPSPAQKIATAREVLKDPAAAREVMSDPDVRTKSIEAVTKSFGDEADRKNPTKVTNRASDGRERGDSTRRNPDSAQVQVLAVMQLKDALHRAGRLLRQATDAWNASGVLLDSSDREATREDYDSLLAVVQMSKDAVLGQITDSDLQDLLRGES